MMPVLRYRGRVHVNDWKPEDAKTGEGLNIGRGRNLELLDTDPGPEGSPVAGALIQKGPAGIPGRSNVPVLWLRTCRPGPMPTACRFSRALRPAIVKLHPGRRTQPLSRPGSGLSPTPVGHILAEWLALALGLAGLVGLPQIPPNLIGPSPAFSRSIRQLRSQISVLEGSGVSVSLVTGASWGRNTTTCMSGDEGVVVPSWSVEVVVPGDTS
ncbi:hypothetical protein R1flu_000855 [Riccia fluitans]|uniref:Uncharacterized protein n=1 Tax=Riccia fluitans TaxID=41844 RepID=A0ABD1Y1N6_9MARC